MKIMYEVIDYASNESHGSFGTLDEARGCVAYDRLLTWGIFDGSGCVEEMIKEDVL